MKKIVYQSKAIQAVILMVAAALLLSLWPFRLWREQVTASVSPVTGTMTEGINEERTLLQGVIAQFDHMDTIDVYLGEDSVGESFYVRILDEQWQMICEEKTAIDHENLPGFQSAMIDVDMEPGKMYYVILQGEESEIFAGYEAVSSEDMPWLGTMYYADSTVEGVGLAANYHYGVPLRKMKVLALGVLILGVTALSLLAVRLWYRKRQDRLITVEKVFKRIANPVVGILTALSLGAVLLGYCGHYLLDNSVYAAGIILLAGILFYGINHNRDGQQAIVTWDYLKSHAGDLVQSAAIAGALWGCCDYVSGLYDIHHAAAERRELFWFAIAVIAMFKWKEIFNLCNLVYLIGAGGYALYYYRSGMAAFPEDVEEPVKVAFGYTVLIGFLLGLILIRTVVGLCRKKLAKPVWLYTGILALFFAALILFRNGRWWGVAMVAAFTLFYLNYGMWEHKERILVNIARGAVLQFALATGYALLHRPYVTFRNARYTHIFHTVTITATYLTMIECVAAVLVLGKFRKSRRLRDCWKELTLFGVVSSYMLFTMARTAFFSVGAALLFALIVTSAGRGRERFRSFGKNLGMLVLAVVVCFPVTFTAQRNVPALVSEPFLYEIEYSMYCPEDVMRGRRLDSLNFMRVGRFIDVFAEKIFGIPEGTFDIYGELAEYERTHRDDEEEQTDARAVYDVAGRRFGGAYALSGEEQTEAGTSGEHSGGEEGAAGAEPDKGDVLVASAGALPESILLAAAQEGSDAADDPASDGGSGLLPEGAREDNDYTNGRLDIFRSYMEQLNMTGHEEMGAVLKDGAIATHAHNIYLQVAYDHGIPVGILFVVVGIATFVTACLYYHKKKDKITCAALPVVIVTAVAVAGMVEWVFQLSNPCGFMLMLVITPLIFRNEG